MIRIGVRDFVRCPISFSVKSGDKKSSMRMISIYGRKTGHDLEDVVSKYVTKVFDAVTEFDVSMTKTINKTNFKIVGKVDTIIRRTTPNGILLQVIELKYDPTFDGTPKREHLKQLATYMQMLKSDGLTVVGYLQYWKTQNPDYVKYIVTTRDYPKVNDVFVETFEIDEPTSRELFKEALFDFIRGIAWKTQYPDVVPMSLNECITCPYRNTCTFTRDPTLKKIYNAINYEKYKKNEITIPPTVEGKEYVKLTIRYAKRLNL